MLVPVCDIISPGVYANPALLHERYARCRREDPVLWVDQEPYRPFWAVTRHADIMEVERQNALFISEPRVTLVPREVEDQTLAALGKRTAMVRSLLDMDEPDHRKYRSVAQSWADSNLKCNTCHQVRFADVITSFVLVIPATSA